MSKPYKPRPRKSLLIDRLMAKVVYAENGCWLYSGFGNQYGYGRVKSGGKLYLAHRVSYELHNGPVPAGMQLDHICHDPIFCAGGNSCPHRCCINPDHLIVCTGAENNSPLRKSSVNATRASWSKIRTECGRGHKFSIENTRINLDGTRGCRACGRIRDEQRRRDKGLAVRGPRGAYAVDL